MSRTAGGRRALPAGARCGARRALGVARRFGRDPEFSRGGGGNASREGRRRPVHQAQRRGPGGPDRGWPGAARHRAAAGAAPRGAPSTAAPPASEPGDRRRGQAARLAEAGGRRPSVELLFHALLPERYVLHTHPIVINAVTCNRDGAALARAALRRPGAVGARTRTRPAARPGHRGAAPRPRASAPAGRPPRITLLQNHGIIVAADRAAEIDERSAWLVAGGPGRRWARRGARPDACRRGRRGLVPGGMDPARARALVDAIGPDAPRACSAGPSARSRWSPSTRRALAARFTATPDGRAFVLGGPLYPRPDRVRGVVAAAARRPGRTRTPTTCRRCSASA